MNAWEEWLDELMTVVIIREGSLTEASTCFERCCIQEWKENFYDGLTPEEAYKYWTEE